MYTSTNGAVDYYALSTLDLTGKQPVAVAAWVQAWKNDASASQLRVKLRDGDNGSVVNSGWFGLPTSQGDLRYFVRTSNCGGGSWTATNIDNLQIGIEANIP